MKTSEFRELSSEELTRKLGELKKELFDLRNERAGGKLSAPHRLKMVRRETARLLTVLNGLREGK